MRSKKGAIIQNTPLMLYYYVWENVLLQQKAKTKASRNYKKSTRKKQAQNCSCHMPLAKLQHRLERSAPKRNLSSHSCPVDIQSLWHPRKAYIRYKGPTPLRTTHTLISIAIGIILACFLRCTGDELAKRFRFSQGLFWKQTEDQLLDMLAGVDSLKNFESSMIPPNRRFLICLPSDKQSHVAILQGDLREIGELHKAIKHQNMSIASSVVSQIFFWRNHGIL